VRVAMIGHASFRKTAPVLVAEGIWFVRDADDLQIALRDLEASGAFADEVRVQDLSRGRPKLARGGLGAHLPDLGSIRVIESETFR